MTPAVADEARAERRLLWALVAMCVAVLLAAQSAVSFFALRAFEDELAPQLHRKAEVVGQSVGSQLVAAVELGIPLAELVGMDAFLHDVIEDNPDILYLAVLDPAGRVLHANSLPEAMHGALLPPAGEGDAEPSLVEHDTAFDTSIPLMADGQRIGSVHVGVDKAFVRGELAEIFHDVLTVLLVSLLVTLELILFFVVVHISAPMQMVRDILGRAATGDFTRLLAMRGRDEIGRFCARFDLLVRRLNERFFELRQDAEEVRAGQIDMGVVRRIDTAMDQLRRRFRFAEPEKETPGDSRLAMRIRAPLFLFMFSEELSRSFLPLFVRELYAPIAGLEPAVVIGLPITLFMAVVAVITPLAGTLTDRFGARRVFLAGIVPAILGYVGACFALTIHDFLLWRGLSALGYGLIFISTQSYIAETTTRASRAQGMAIFVGAVAAAGICGPSIGGIIADRIGFRLTFLVSAVLALAAAWIVYAMLEPQHRPSQRQAARLRLRDVLWLLRDFQFLTTVLFAAIPGKLILAGFLFYLAPLYLDELGNGQSAIGRMMMTYGLASIALAPLAARWADGIGRHGLFVGLGGLVSGLGCLAVLQAPSSWAVLTAIVCLGIGQAAALPNQLALVQEIAARYRDGLGQATVLGAYRLLERLGTVAGPIVVASLLQAFGYAGAVAGTGALVIATSILFALSRLAGPMPDAGAAEEPA